MRINHNIAALNTYNQLSQNNNVQQQSLEKLSSGLRINSAADDAAGLAISEKMRGQIQGLDMATKNSEDGISMIQTAEGSLNESHSILQRMRELAVQSANDTNTETDRAEIQEEVDKLSQELSRIGDTTEFNTQKLLNGNFEGTFQIGANESQNISLEIGDMRGYNLGVAGDVAITQEAAWSSGTELDEGSYTIKEDDSGDYELINSDGVVVGNSTNGTTWEDTASTTETMFEFDDAVTSGTIEVYDDSGSLNARGTAYIDNNGLQAGEYTVDGTDVLDSTGTKIGEFDSTAGEITDLSGETLVENITTDLTDSSFKVGGVDVSSQEASNDAVTTIDNAIENVSSERSKLGAYQNRLEHTINNLGTASENLTAAESRIRDVDYAEAA